MRGCSEGRRVSRKAETKNSGFPGAFFWGSCWRNYQLEGNASYFQWGKGKREKSPELGDLDSSLALATRTLRARSSSLCGSRP